MTDVLGDQHAAFVRTVASLPPAELATALRRAVDSLMRYGDLDIGSESRLEIVMEMTRELAPLLFSSRFEPRATITAAWRAAARSAPSEFFAAVDLLLFEERADWGPPNIAMLVELLAELAPTVPSATAYRAQARLKADFERFRCLGPLAALVALAPNSATAVLAMLERLEGDGMLTSSAVQAGVRKVCRWEPDRLNYALSLYSDRLFSEADDPDAAQFLLIDLIARQGPETMLFAIRSIDPRHAPRLFAAAFDGSAPPFTIFDFIEGEAADFERETLVGETGQHVAQGGPEAIDSDPDWNLKVKLVTGAQTRIGVVDRNPADGLDYEELYDDLFNDDGDGFGYTVGGAAQDGGLADEFARRMNLRVLV